MLGILSSNVFPMSMLMEIPTTIGNFTSSPCGMAEFVGEVQQRKM
jgi:hypothetical protein